MGLRNSGHRAATVWPVTFSRDVVVIGGCGHVGLPLALALANAGLDVEAFDIDQAAVRSVNDGVMPFLEPEGPAQLEKALAAGLFRATTDPTSVASAEHVIVVIGTPVDEHLNPDPMAVARSLESVSDQLAPGQLVVLRSTVYPGVTQLVERMVDELVDGVDVAFCPERIAEGKAFTELYSLPQIVSGRTERAMERAALLFSNLTGTIVRCSPEEAELAKLFTNTWRYIKFAAANQFFMMANDFGVDFENVRQAITHDYPRAADLPGPGFAAGPCLFKDTMQLAAFHKNNFALGHSAMMVNEGLPAYLVERLRQRHDLGRLTVGILGMAFKAESDDIRSSLSYKLKRILTFEAKSVLCADPYVTVDPDLVGVEELINRSDIVVIGAPHGAFRDLDLSDVELVDVWDLFGGGVVI